MSFKLYTSFILVLIWSQNTYTANILALFINGHKSHLVVYASVVNLLLQRGHNVTVITTLNVNDILDVNRVKWLKLSSNYTEIVVASNSNGFKGLSKIERMLKRIENTSNFMSDPKWKAFLEEDNIYDLLILGYLFNDYQLALGAYFKCPVVLIWTGQPMGFLLSLLSNPEERRYVTQAYDSHQFTGFKAIIFGWFEKSIEYLACRKMREIYDQYFTSSEYPSFAEIRKTVALVLCNHHSLSEGPIAPYLPSIIEIGGIDNKFMSYENKFELRNFSKPNRNIIYFSFGSKVKWSSLPDSLEQTFIRAFKLFETYTILWTYDKNCTELELKFTCKNVKCKSWWPQTSILANNHTKLFITHGGKGSIAEAQLYGVPMLGISFLGDQKVNVNKMVDRGFGLKLNLENITFNALEKSLYQLLNLEIYAANIKRFSKLYHDRPVSSEDSAVYWLEYVLRYNGAKHLQSPALNLNFFQYYLLDVYFFILLSFLAILWGLNVLENKFISN